MNNDSASAGIKRTFMLVAAVLVIAAVVFGSLLYNRTKSMTLSQIRNNALDVARITAELIDTKAFASLRVGDEGKEAYAKVMNVLVEVRDSTDVEYVYTIRYNDYGVPVFCVDSDPVDPGYIGEPYSGASAALKALNGEPAADDAPYKDRWGTHISAYAPIKLDGKTIGAAVVDINYLNVRAEIREVSALVLALYAATILVGVLLLIYSGRQIQKYEFRLRKVKEQVEEHERVSARFFSPLTSGTRVVPGAGVVKEGSSAEGKDSFLLKGKGLRARYEEAGGLDYDEAIKMLGSEALLEQTLKQFYEDASQGADEIERLWREGDFENFAIKVHALKSGARVIGAGDLSDKAKRLEDLGNRVAQA